MNLPFAKRRWAGAAPPSSPSGISRLSFLAAAIGLAVSGTASAELLGYRYSDASGNYREVGQAQVYINPTGDMTFAMSAGLDRKVRVSILAADGSLVASKTSQLLGASDRISFAGSDYYGAFLNLPAPADGQYTVKAEILSGADQVVKDDSYTLVVDTAAPSASAMTATNAGYRQVVSGDVWRIGSGGSEETFFKVSGISDSSPVVETKVRLYRGGSLHFERDANYDAVNKILLARNDSGFFPSSNLDEDFQVQMTIADKAGNVWASQLQTVRWDSVVNAPSAPFGVFDPDSSEVLGPGLTGFVPYQAGMEVKTNPVRLAYKIPKSNWHEYAESGLSLVNSLGEKDVVGTDDENVYIIWSAPFGLFNSNQTRWDNFGQWGGANPAYNLKLSESAAKTPVVTNLEYEYSDIGWASAYRQVLNNSKLPLTIGRARATVESRPYDQLVQHRGSCTVPAGETSCLISINYTLATGTTGYLRDATVAYNPDKTLVSSVRYADLDWNDKHYPVITSYEYDEGSKELTAFIRQPSRGAYFDRLRLHSAWLEDGNGNPLSITGGKTDENVENYTFKWDLKTAPEGVYDIVIAAMENHGPVTRQQVFNYTADRTAPEVTITTSTGKSSVSTLDEFLVSVEDAIDENPRIESIQLRGGPAEESVFLAWREEASGEYRLEYPTMFPSLSEGEEYTLVVSAIDDFANKVTREHTFTFTPPTVKVVGDSGQGVKIPAVTKAFTRADGSNVVTTEPITLSDGSLVAGTYDVTATLRSDSQVALAVNGVRIQPGETLTVLRNYNFGANEGRISLPVSVAEDQTVGKASLLISTTAPNTPIVVVDIEAWKPNLALTSPSWSIYPALDEVKIGVEGMSPAGCARVVDTMAEAKEIGDPLTDPTCLVEWREFPKELYATEDAGAPQLRGYTAAVGNNEVQADIYLVSKTGQRVLLESVERNLEVLLPDGSIKTRLNPELPTVERMLEFTSFEIEQVDGPKCSIITVSEEAALTEAGRGRPSCLLTWSQIPNGLVPAKGNAPRLEGPLEYQTGEKASMAWSIDAYTPAGVKVPMGSYSHDITLVDPPRPEITIESDKSLGGDLYYLPSIGGTLGEYQVSGRPAEILFSETFNGEKIHDGVTPPTRSSTSKTSRRISLGEAPLWSYSTFEVQSHYASLPDQTASKAIRVLSVPDEALRPLIDLAETTVLNTGAMDVKVSIKNPFDMEQVFSESSMGQWEVRLMDYRSQSKQDPLTEFQPVAADGTVSFSVDPKQIDAKGFRLAAEARLISPEPLYQRQVLSPRPVYVTVLRGEAIQGAVKGQRLAGQSPLTVMAAVQLANELDREAIKQIVWQSKAEGSDEWVDLEGADDGAGRIVKTYETGRYQLRARITNANSGAEFTTEAIDIHAFDVPAASLEGPWNVFIGDEATYRVTAKLNDQPVPADQLKVLWSLDDGKTWTAGSDTLSLTRDKAERVAVSARVRLASADESLDEAWVETRGRVTFRAVMPPRASIVGPGMVEVGTEQEWRTSLQTPFQYMDVQAQGYFLLPDGTRVDGDTLRYTPSEADLQAGRLNIRYVSWIDGFPQSESVIDRDVLVWVYEWPKWEFNSRLTAAEAPATANIRVRSPSGRARYIEGLKYDWRLPAGVEVLSSEASDLRILSFKQPGAYEISVDITDDRGNATTLTETITMNEQTPWVADYRTSYSNSHMRAPLKIDFRPLISGGHPHDRVESFRYLLDGQVVAENVRYGSIVVPEGTHEIAMQFNTAFGHTVEKREQLVVKPNAAPACSLTVREYDSSWRLYANCTDSDGVIARHNWLVNGEAVGLTGSRISLSRGDAKPEVTLVGVDDAGAESEPVRW